MAITSRRELYCVHTNMTRRVIPVISLADSSTAQRLNQTQPIAAQPLHESGGPITAWVCDACPNCSDTCGNDECERCASKLLRTQQHCCIVKESPCEQEYTICQVRRHGHEKSAWLLAGDWIYDATEYMTRHPGGSISILKKSGGKADCTEDLYFHSKAGQRLWAKYRVGRLKPCPSQVKRTERHWWKFWDALDS